MRFFGVQIGFTIMVALLYRKLGRNYSFAHWLISNGNLHLYYASLVSILEQRGDQKSMTKKSNVPIKESICTDFNFTVEKIREVKLYKQKLSYKYLQKADQFDDFTTQIDSCVLALTVAFFTQFFFYISPSSEETQLNLALFWLLGLLLNLVYRATKILLIYFNETLSYELSLCILFGLIYFLLAFVMLSIPSTREELNIGELETSLFQILKDFNITNNPTKLRDDNSVYVCFVMSLFAAFVGMALLFPSNRISKCHTRCIQMCNKSFLSYLWYQLVFWLPILPCIFWIPTTGREMLAEGPHGVTDMQTFAFLRALSFPLVVCIRIVSSRAYIQAFLERPNDILTSLQMKNSRLNALLLYSTLTLPNSYISMVAIHCTILPCLVICFTASAWFLAGFPTAIYTCLYHTCVFCAWWCCVSSMMSSVIALLYQNYIELKD